jgi:hypothetical protein
VRVSFGDVSLASIDLLSEIEAACLFIFEDERPLRGVAGYLDWRLCGSLSHMLRDGHFAGTRGEALLFPVWGRVPMGRVFCFGSGKSTAFDGRVFSEVSRHACEALTKAGARGFVAHLPPVQ